MMYANKKSSYQWMVPSLCASWKLIGKTLTMRVFSLNSLVKKHGNLSIIHGHFEAYHSLSCFLFVFRIIDFLCVIQRFRYLVKMIYLLKEFQVKKERVSSSMLQYIYIDYFKTNNYKNKVRRSLPIKLCVCN